MIHQTFHSTGGSIRSCPVKDEISFPALQSTVNVPTAQDVYGTLHSIAVGNEGWTVGCRVVKEKC